MTEPKIPKFGSFRPAKPLVSPDVAQAHASEPLTKQRTTKKHEISGTQEGHRQRSHRRRRSQSREKSNSRHLHNEPLCSRDSHPVDIFVVDRRGDEKNLVYGSIHRYNIPPFHRYGAGHILGLSTEFKIDRNFPDDKDIILFNWKDSRGKTREKYIFSRAAKNKPRLLKIRPECFIENSVAEDENFVPLSASKSRKRKRGDIKADTNVDDTESEKDERDYRSIYGKGKTGDNLLDDELRYVTESESSGSDAGRIIKTDAKLQKKTIELSRRVDQTPHNINNWLALIDHQDLLLKSGHDHRRITSAEMSSTADIKIHMYEKALCKITSLEDRERLLLGLMVEGAKIWDIKTQSHRWEQISKDNIDSLVLWTSYLNFKQSNFSEFQFEEIKELFLGRIKLLKGALAKAELSSIIPLFHQLLYVYLRLTLFIRESGYSELSIAIWQAILEMGFFAPVLSVGSDKAADIFKEFWESEVPRIGETGALGWKKFVEDETLSEIPDVVVDEPDDFLEGDIFESWATTERLRSSRHLPARTMDDVAEDDPYRVILFSDIEDHLFFIPLESEELRALCIDAFLLFCRLPIIGGNGSASPSQQWSLDPLIRNEFLECGIKFGQDGQGIEANDVSDGQIQSILNRFLVNFQNSSDSLFASHHWFKTRSWQDRFSASNEPVPYKFVRNVLKQLTNYLSCDKLAEYYLAFEYVNEPATIKKASKSVIKLHPSSIRLYNAYAMIEWTRNKEAASGVFSAALNMRSSSETQPDDLSIVLWKSWVWGYMEDGDMTSALALLLCIPDNKPDLSTALSAPLLLKSNQYLSSKRDFLLAFGSIENAVSFGECLALLEYITGSSNIEPRSSAQGDITTAMSSYTTFANLLQTHPRSSQVAQELFLQSASRLLLHHTRSGPYRPSLLRYHLSNFITLFPQNTIFLSIYAWNERNLRVENRVRNILLEKAFKPGLDNIAARVFAIYHEISQGTIHSAKSAFEHAIISPVCKNSPGLWKFYLLYMLSIPEFRPKAKDLWYRALRDCPWSKELYILGLENLRANGLFGKAEEVEFREMKSAWRVMGEKGLRVHVDLEDRFEDMLEMEQKFIK